MVVAFIFFGRHVPERAVQAPIVVPIQPVEGEFFDVLKGLQWARHERSGLRHGLVLVKPHDRLRRRVIVGVSDGSDRGDEAFQSDSPGEFNRYVLRSGIRAKPNSP